MHHPATLASINARLDAENEATKEDPRRTIGQTTVPYAPSLPEADTDAVSSEFVEIEPAYGLVVDGGLSDPELPDGLDGSFATVSDILRAVYVAGYQFRKRGFDDYALDGADHISRRLSLEVVNLSGILTRSQVL